MKKVKVIFRKIKNPYTGELEIIAFFPELNVNCGNIMSYAYIGQHCEGELKNIKRKLKNYSLESKI